LLVLGIVILFNYKALPGWKNDTDCCCVTIIFSMSVAAVQVA